MSNYASGRRAEYKTQEVLEAAGYETIRAASSKGFADVVAASVNGIRFISVKSGTGRVSPAERETLKFMADDLRGRATVEIWHWPARAREAKREVL